MISFTTAVAVFLFMVNTVVLVSRIRRAFAHWRTRKSHAAHQLAGHVKRATRMVPRLDAMSLLHVAATLPASCLLVWLDQYPSHFTICQFKTWATVCVLLHRCFLYWWMTYRTETVLCGVSYRHVPWVLHGIRFYVSFRTVGLIFGSLYFHDADQDSFAEACYWGQFNWLPWLYLSGEVIVHMACVWWFLRPVCQAYKTIEEQGLRQGDTNADVRWRSLIQSTLWQTLAIIILNSATIFLVLSTGLHPRDAMVGLLIASTLNNIVAATDILGRVVRRSTMWRRAQRLSTTTKGGHSSDIEAGEVTPPHQLRSQATTPTGKSSAIRWAKREEAELEAEQSGLKLKLGRQRPANLAQPFPRILIVSPSITLSMSPSPTIVEF